MIGETPTSVVSPAMRPPGVAPLDAPRDRPRAVLALFHAGFDTLEIAAHLCCGEAEVAATLDAIRLAAGRRLGRSATP